MTFDDLVAQGIRDTLKEKCAEYLPDRKKHHFSIAYKIRRRSIIRSRRKRAPLSIRRIKYILIAVILALFALTGFSLWRQFGPFSFNIFKDHSKVYFSGENGKTEIKEIYGLPEEYELLSFSQSKIDALSEYLVNGEVITLNQYLITSVNKTNTENNNAEFVLINGNEGIYIKEMFDDESYISWCMDGYRFYLLGKIDKNEAMHLAESLKIRNFVKIP